MDPKHTLGGLADALDVGAGEQGKEAEESGVPPQFQS